MLNKSLEQWLEDYGESHQNLVNKQIHWVCVPLILWSILALLWHLGPASLPWFNAATLLILCSLVFYSRLSWTLALGMGVLAAVSIALIIVYQFFASGVPLWAFALVVFILAWVGQFVGHKIEGKKPSFFEDIQFLLIGPAWLMSFAYRRLGIPLST